ncbi:MAG: adenylate kinase, partial [Lachnospiraceae bacterium]|nr:adenylate kinase [Lachnospiraceae bacterium]
YVPFDWRQDFGEEYLSFIRFICLAFSDEYIDRHFPEILAHASAIERRISDDDCTAEGLKRDNRRYIEGFRKAGENPVIIRDDYEETLRSLLG